MNNTNAQTAIEDCERELEKINHLIQGLGTMTPVTSYLSKYCLVKVCGTIEYCFKTIIADFYSVASPQLSCYLDKKIRQSSKNPSYNNICSLLKDFNEEWNHQFKNTIEHHPSKTRILTSLESMNNNRNNFAHGQGCTPSFSDIQSQFSDARIVINILDEVVQ